MYRRGELDGVYRFGRFTLDPTRRSLRHEQAPVHLSALLFDLLVLLATNADRLVTKAEVRETLWPGRVVEEGSLKQCVFGLRQALTRFDPETRYIATVPGRGYRLAAPVAFDTEIAFLDAPAAEPPPSVKRRPWRLIAAASGLAAAAVLAVGIGWTSISRPAPVRRIVGPVFENRTGEAAFDHLPETLTRIDLAQSSSLEMVSDAEIRSTLAFMRRPQDASLSPALADEVCRRLGASATVDGGVDRLGSRYLLTAKAVDCSTGRVLVSERAAFAAREDAPAALDRIAGHLRQALGQSALSATEDRLGLVRAATTPSFEALRAYSEAMYFAKSGHEVEEEPLLKQAIALDSKFATAWLALAVFDSNTGDSAGAAAAITKAYALRGAASAREAQKIEVDYADFALHDPMAAVRILKSWLAYNDEDIYAWCDLGDELGAAAQAAEAIEPLKRCTQSKSVADEGSFGNLMDALAHTGRIAEARAVAVRARAQGKSSSITQRRDADLAFLQGDQSAPLRLADAVRGKITECWILYDAVSAALAQGRIRAARDLQARAAAAAKRDGWAIYDLPIFALGLTRLGFDAEGQALTRALPDTADPAWLDLALAVGGDPQKASALLQKRLAAGQKDPVLLYEEAPTVRAALLARQGRPAEALDQMRAAEAVRPSGFDIGADFSYERGLVALQAQRPAEAARAFRDVLDVPGRDPVSPKLPLAHLGLARALTALGDRGGAHGEYQILFRLWAAADRDLPPLLAAQAEDRALEAAKGQRT